MPLFLKFILMALLYMFVAGLVMAIISNYIDESPWNNPGPILGGIFWPVVLPLVVGYRLIKKRDPTNPPKELPKAKVVRKKSEYS